MNTSSEYGAETCYRGDNFGRLSWIGGSCPIASAVALPWRLLHRAGFATQEQALFDRLCEAGAGCATDGTTTEGGTFPQDSKI